MSKEIEMQVVGTDGNYEVILPVPATHASSHSSNGTDPINEIREQHNGLAQKFWRGTQAEYDALTTKDEDTMYIVTDASSAASGDMLKEVYDTEKKNTDIFKYVDTHANNNTIHVTADERNAWNAKLDSFTETDPTVPDWAKQATKPTYTASEVGALPSSTVIPSKTSQLTNDSGYITGYTETDPTVPDWAKAESKPTYTASEVGAVAKTGDIMSGELSVNTGGNPTAVVGINGEFAALKNSSTAGVSELIVGKPTNTAGFQLLYGTHTDSGDAYSKVYHEGYKPTAAEVGASPSGHTHDDRYYTETEVNNLMASKQDASSAINTGNIGSQSVNYANSAGSAPAAGGTADCTYSLDVNGNSHGASWRPFWQWDGSYFKLRFIQPDGSRVDNTSRVNYADGAGNADTVDGWHMNLDPGSYGIKAIAASTGDITPGSTGLATGHIYLVYE